MFVRAVVRVMLGLAAVACSLPAGADSQYGDDSTPAPATAAHAPATSPGSAPAAVPAPSSIAPSSAPTPAAAPAPSSTAPSSAPTPTARPAASAPAPAAAAFGPSTPPAFGPAPAANAHPSSGPAPTVAIAAPQRNAAPIVPLDRVIAVVNDEAVTQWDLGEQRRIVLQQMKAANVPPPAPDVLDKQVLERLISERSLLQFAKENGIRIDDTTVERTVARVAEENKMSVDDFRKALEKEGMTYPKYREELRNELTVQRIREREVDSKILITDAEVNNYLQTVAAQAGGDNEYLLSHVYVGVPEQASPDQIAARRKRADEALAKIKGGEEFSQVAAAYSDAPDALQGGSLGWRSPARLPSVFADVVRTLKPGDVSTVLRSPAGFHVVKLVEIRNTNAPTVVEQSHVRHILVKVNEQTSDLEAKTRIERARDRIVSGGAKFEDIAKANSDDISRVRGGDLGWVSPGDTVPDFEKAMNALKIDEISKPVRTPFGWHIIEVLERRKQDITLDRKREQARLAIRQRKSEEQFQDFVRQLRDRTYVELKLDER